MAAAKRTYDLSLLSGLFLICRLDSDADVPEWAWRGYFCSVTRTAEELSIVVEREVAPVDLRTGVNWRALKVHGPFELSEVGVLSSLVGPLAAGGVSVFTISTFGTDYLLVQTAQWPAARAALREAGHTIHEREVE
jgi:uncharacterized protein